MTVAGSLHDLVLKFVSANPTRIWVRIRTYGNTPVISSHNDICRIRIRTNVNVALLYLLCLPSFKGKWLRIFGHK